MDLIFTIRPHIQHLIILVTHFSPSFHSITLGVAFSFAFPKKDIFVFGDWLFFLELAKTMEVVDRPRSNTIEALPAMNTLELAYYRIVKSANVRMIAINEQTEKDTNFDN